MCVSISPLSMSFIVAVTLPSGWLEFCRPSWRSQPTTSFPLITQSPTRLSSSSCSFGRSITSDGRWPRFSAGVARSNVANHSFEMPSFSPLIRSPMQLPASMISSCKP